MPLLNGKPFHKIQPPKSLEPDDEVFLCPVTLEIFNDYDEYFERTILVNSTTWQCGVCGRGPIKYSDAVQCEKNDSRQLNAFDSSLSAGLLHIIAATKCKRLPDLVELLCNFASSRFFIGEAVEFYTRKYRCFGIITQVLSSNNKIYLPPKNDSDDNSNPTQVVGLYLSQSENSSDLRTASNAVDTDDNTGPLGLLPADQLLYCIMENKRADPPSVSSLAPNGPCRRAGGPFFLRGADIQRRGNCALTRDRIRYFIRHTCELADGCFTPKPSILQRYGLHPHGPLSWSDLFITPEPKWPELLKYYASLAAPLIAKPISQSVNGIESGSASYFAAVTNRSANLPTTASRKQSLLETSTNTDSKEPRSSDVGALNSEPVKAYSEPTQRSDRVSLECEWFNMRRREDMELSDLVPLPDFPPFPTRLPPTAIGPALQLLEFFHVFGSTLDLYVPKPHQTGSKPPLLSWFVLEQALVESDPCGPLADLFISLLVAIRRLDADFNNKRSAPTISTVTYSAANIVAAAEVGAPFSLSVISSGLSSSESNALFDDLLLAPGGVSSNTLQLLRDTGAAARFNELVGIPYAYIWTGASRAALSLSQHHSDTCSTLKKDETATSTTNNTTMGVSKTSYTRAVSLAVLSGATALCPLDRIGLTTALRLYFTTAAARGGCWRGVARFSMRPLDDPAFMLCREHGPLLEKLKTVSIYDLNADEKLVLLGCLMDQLFLHPTIRDRVDARAERQRLIRFRMRQPLQSKLPLEQSLCTSSPSLSVSDNRTFTGTTTPTPGRGRPSSTSSAVLNSKDNSGVEVKKLTSTDGQSSAPPNAVHGGTANSTAATTPNVSTEPSSSTVLDDLPTDKLKLLDELIEASRGSSMLPLGQDRFCRRYWLILSIPCILIEDAPTTAEHPLAVNPLFLSKQLSAFHPDAADALGLSSASQAGIRLREFASIHPEIHREALTEHLCIQLPSEPTNRVLTMEQLKMLVLPERVSQQDFPIQAKSPAVIQAHRLRLEHQRSEGVTTNWTILTPMQGPIPAICTVKSEPTDDATDTLDPQTNVDSPSPTESDTEPSLVDQATWTIDCLEAGLNPRGVRESRLRRIIGGLRPLLIRVVAQCPTELLNSSALTSSTETTSANNTVAMPAVRSDKPLAGFWTQSTSHDSTPTDWVLLNWLELALRRMATRLGLRELMHDCFVAAVETKNTVSDLPTDSAYRNDCKQEPSESTDQNGFDSTYNSRLRQLSRMLLLFGQALGTRCLLGPLADDLRSVRVVPADDPGVSRDSLPVFSCGTGRFSSDSLQPDGHYTTTGWQRWCARVNQAQSASELHLLARALERGIRRMLLFGHTLKLYTATAKIGGYIPPKLRCTACKSLPDLREDIIASGCTLAQAQLATIADSLGPYVPFCACAGCAAPFHLDCLLHSQARNRRIRDLRRQSEKSRHPMLNTRLLQDRGLQKADVLNAVGCISFRSTLANQFAMRAETVVGSLFLCRTCLRAAGQDPPHSTAIVESNSDTEEIQTFTGDEDWEPLPEEPEDGNESTPIQQRKSAKPIMEVDQDADSNISINGPGLSPMMSLRRRRLTSRLKSDYTSWVSSGSESELFEDSDGTGMHASGRTTASRRSEHQVSGMARRVRRPLSTTKWRSAIRHKSGRRSFTTQTSPSCRTTESTAVVRRRLGRPSKRPCSPEPQDISDSDSLKDIILKFPTIKRVSVVLSPCDMETTTSSHPSRQPTARRGRPQKRPESVSRAHLSNIPNEESDHDTSDSAQSSSSGNGLELDQSTTGKLLSELCASHLARPLLRCGLGRPLQGVLTEHNQSDSSDEHASTPRGQVRRARSARLQSASRLNQRPIREQLCAWDLTSLQELVMRGELPGGPHEAIPQLRLLFKHWLSTNRPGSRVHQCALGLSALLDQKLTGLGRAAKRRRLSETDH